MTAQTRPIQNDVVLAAADEHLTYFGRKLQFETDPADLAAALASGSSDLVVIDSRSPQAFAAGHIPGAVNLPRPFGRREVDELPEGELVVYCWGPGCNGATRTCHRLAELGRRAKELIGGFEYWVREGHPVEGGEEGGFVQAHDRDGVVKLPHEVSCLC